MQSDEFDWIDWLRLLQIPGVGNETARKLLTAFGLPSQVFQSDFSALQSQVSARVARLILQAPDDALKVQIELTQNWLQQPGNHVLTLADERFPSSLLTIPDPPLMLYVKGRLDLISHSGIAVVGSRNATVQGIHNAEKFSEHLSQAGLTISSGLAAGIDAAAHQGALRGNGSTIAVIGTGADIVYPARNRVLAHQIAEQGCIVSEYALATPAIASNFPRRNRIISGLSHAVLVIEAAAQSGSLITARMAAEQGRDVFAIPGSIHSPLAKGCHQLIKQGAKLVETAQDILDEIQVSNDLKLYLPSVSITSETGHEPELLSLIGYDPVHLDNLVTRAGVGIHDLSAQLLELELQGVIEVLPSGLIQRLHLS
ncbi:DNA-processing protein DprA [Undibacterium sp. Di24W]|uniref:DNA-processing protein DprA n=1 Tax=Undibacterium sp. Di24W TaxID=3413033 RepID=UPI003BF0BD18